MRSSLANPALDSGSGIRLEPNIAWSTVGKAHGSRREAPVPALCLADYVEQRFIPDHVSFKTEAGRTHYQAMLKHVLTPEAVERMFAPYNGASRGRLRSLKTQPGWPYLDHVRLCDLNADHVKRLTSSASARGYSPQTIVHIKSVLGKVIYHARKEGFFRGENPASEIKLPAIQHRNAHKLTILEAKRILRLMPHPDREIALICMTTGLAVSEICLLRWKDINLSEKAVDCDGEVVPPHHAYVKRHPHDAQGVSPAAPQVRIVEIPEPLARRLQRIRRAIGPSEPETLLVTTLGGPPFCPADFCSRLELIRKEVGLPWLSCPALKRAHHTLLSDLRAQLSAELMSELNSAKSII